MNRIKQNRAEFFLHTFTVSVFILFIALFVGNNKTTSDIPLDSDSVITEVSFEFEALAGTPPRLPDFDEGKAVSENTVNFGFSTHLFALQEAHRSTMIEYIQQYISFQTIRPVSAKIGFVMQEFSPRGEENALIS